MNNLDRDVEGAAKAHQVLLAHLDELDDADVRRPSLLPDWSVGHVLTHIARNAEGLQRMLDGAAAGDVAAMYPGGLESRNADIEAGATRSARALVTDVRSTIYSLEAAWMRLDAAAWEGTGRMVIRDVPVAEIPLLRWREVVVHHADVGLGYSWADWPADYVRYELVRATMMWSARQPMGMTNLPEEALSAPPNLRLAWLFGRAEIDGLSHTSVL